jgi:hypothetical protein
MLQISFVGPLAGCGVVAMGPPFDYEGTSVLSKLLSSGKANNAIRVCKPVIY